MAVQARDGSMHHSAGRAKLHDETGGKGGNPPMMKAAKQSPAGESNPAPSPHSIEDHVAEHGPAVAMHHKHDKATGKHHVTTHHGANGMEKHHSVHGNPKDAHEHMATAMGLNEGASEESPDEAYGGTESPEEEAAESKTGGGIPGLA